MTGLERRSTTLSEARVSPEASGGPRIIRGRAITYDTVSEDLGGFREVFKPGSVRLADDLVILYNHDSGTVLGRISAGTARAWVDARGVLFEAYPPDTQWAADLVVSMQRGDVRACSFAFRVLDENWYVDHSLGSVPIREVTDALVIELSIVALPAYPATNAVVT